MTPRIAIVGLQSQGYILAAGFAQMGYSVDAISNGTAYYEKLNEPGLDYLIRANEKAGRLSFTTCFDMAMRTADFVFLSIDVPFDKKGIDLSTVFEAAKMIEESRSTHSVLCVTSQVPVGTTETLTKGRVAYIPELLRPGHSLENFQYPDRIIIGTDDVEVTQRLNRLYGPLGRPMHHMSIRSAEMSKHVHNAILATQISFTKEMEWLCGKVGANHRDVMKATKADSRVGLDSYLNPGWSLKGGHLIRDVRVLQTLGMGTPLLDAVIEVEEQLT